VSAGAFVTGTGTEVGKTVVAAVLARTAAGHGRSVSVFKPAVSGLDELDGAEPDHELLRRACGSTQTDEQIAPYRYGPAVSPHLAAELAGEPIDRDRLIAAAGAARERSEVLVAEGVGGLLVPLTLDYLVRDFAADLGLPLVVAAAPGLGTINHTLLTVEAARGTGLEVAAVVITPWPRRPTAIELSNRISIERLAAVAVETLERIELSEPASWPPLELDALRLPGGDRH
jgi:dethiobiotin synthetase